MTMTTMMTKMTKTTMTTMTTMMTMMTKTMKMAALAVIAGMSVTAAPAQVYLDPDAPLEERVEDALARMTTHEKVQLVHAQSKFTSPGVPRLGIRQLNMSDGPHGVRAEVDWNTWETAGWTNDSAVAFPSLTCLAATWNREMGRLYGNAVGEEFAYRGKDIMLGPGVTIARLPLNGRSFEYMGEDPYLSGEMAAEYIRAVQDNGVACCVKHFFLNNQEKDRWTVNVNVSERAVEEIYLPAFRKAVQKGGAWTIMGSYNKWNNVHCCENDSLLNKILKDRWGFDGAVISDWGGTHDTWLAATGGLDIEMGTDTNGKTEDNSQGYNKYRLADPFETLVNNGELPMDVLDDKARRVLRTIFRTSMNARKAVGSLCSEAHYEACRTIGAEGIVLLKNAKDILPIDTSRYGSILVVGENAVRNMSEGGGSSELKTKTDISPLDALTRRYGAKIAYVQGYYSGRALYGRVDPLDEDSLRTLHDAAVRAAESADLVIFIGGLNKNCRQDCEDGDRESYELPYGQNALIADLARAQKNIVVVTFGGNPYATPWIDDVRALVHCWYLGSMAGESLADVLSGDVNPSGRLPVTFAVDQDDYPCFAYGEEGYPGVDRQVYYKEGVYVGYRWFDTRGVKTRFPFGYGLSYTSFKYSAPRLSATVMAPGDTISLQVDITNTGARGGKETVQLYVGDDEAAVDRPAKELKGFEKVYVEPGATATVTFCITAGDLAFFDETTHRFVAEPGTYTAYVGASADDVRGSAAFRLE